MSDSVRPHRQKPTRLPRPGDSPGKNTGVGFHFLLQCMKVKVKGKLLNHVQLLATPWTAAFQAPPSMGFSRQEYWSGVPLLSYTNYLTTLSAPLTILTTTKPSLRMLAVLTILHMLTVLHNYSNAKNSTHSANTNYANKIWTIRTYAKCTNNTNSANTNYTIYANKLLTIPNMLTISMILSLLILATLTKKIKIKNKIKEEKN